MEINQQKANYKLENGWFNLCHNPQHTEKLWGSVIVQSQSVFFYCKRNIFFEKHLNNREDHKIAKKKRPF